MQVVMASESIQESAKNLGGSLTPIGLSSSHFPTMAARQSQTPPPFSFPFIEGCIGDESCAHPPMPFLDWSKEYAGDEAVLQMERRTRRPEMKGVRKEKEYPPLIPLLARTENLQSHMPWVLKRTYTTDGRLVLRKEPVKHHEYFRAHRRDGRLTLQLVPLDNEVFDLEDEDDTEREVDTLGDDAYNDYIDDKLYNLEDDGENVDGSTYDGDEHISQVAGAEEDEAILTTPLEIGGGLGKCLKEYNIGQKESLHAYLGWLCQLSDLFIKINRIARYPTN
ncbi:hypothetical protein SAY86_020425 [Trapa natans]|uniref:FAF domain-containing protein n=1 Tax=Trapa natans TaxID=22666 RepID=A0AAN7R6I2_TRANT|nr:hypothetical protein SAY86_020425 [Trapa natans]